MKHLPFSLRDQYPQAFMRNVFGEEFVRVKAAPQSASSGVEGLTQGVYPGTTTPVPALKITTTEVAEAGKANRAILKILAKALAISPSSLEVTWGATSRLKVIKIKN